ncbi:MAG: response regulator [Elusimicrobiota bacterium]
MLAKILVADDNDELRHQLREYLESKHHHVLEATDGAQAFAIAEAEMPHLIIMDIVMPGLYGSTATKHIQDYWRTSKIPIIIISGSVEQSVLGDLLLRPNVRYLKKPVELAVLEATIHELLPEGGYTP